MREILAVLAVVLAPSLHAAESSGVRRIMAAPLSVHLYGRASEKDLDSLRDAVFARVEELDRKLSAYRRDSEITRINLAAPQAVKVSTDTMACLIVAREAWKLSGGAYDALVGAVMKANGRLPDFGTPHPADHALLDGSGLELDTAAATVRLAKAGMWLDLGGVGKGFALREAEAVVAGKVEGAAFDFGGQLHFIGRRPKTGVWPVAVADPRDDRILWAGVIDSGSLSTSAQTEKPGHIVDPRDGWPRGPGGPPGRVAAAVWARDPAWADALSKPAFLMPPSESRPIVESRGGRAFVIDASSSGWITSPP